MSRLEASRIQGSAVPSLAELDFRNFKATQVTKGCATAVAPVIPAK
jgi:hypothetical protein